MYTGATFYSIGQFYFAPNFVVEVRGSLGDRVRGGNWGGWYWVGRLVLGEEINK